MSDYEPTEVRVREVRRREGEFVETAAEFAGGAARIGLGLLRLPLALLPREARTHTMNAVRELSLAFVRLPGDFAEIAGEKIEAWADQSESPSVSTSWMAATVDTMLGTKVSRAPVAAKSVNIVVESESEPNAKTVRGAAAYTQPATSVATGIAITHLEYDPPGKDLDGEYVLIHNGSAAAVDLTGWMLRDTSDHIFSFPPFSLAAGAEVKVWTKSGQADAANLYFNSKTPIWNNTGDTATLSDAAGNTVQIYSYEGSKPS